MTSGVYKRSYKPLKDRLLAKIDKTETCWLWRGSKNACGYGSIACDRNVHNKPRLVKAHRASWEVHCGPIPKGVCVLHTCDIPACVNPAHLFLGTKAENSKDMCAKHRQKTGEHLPQSKLKSDDVIAIRHSNDLQAILAERYGVTQGTISMIRSRATWKHLA